MTKPEGLSLYTTVDDELYDELAELTGQQIVHYGLWEDSLIDAMSDAEQEADKQQYFDLDLYLADGVYFELYGATCHLAVESPPLRGLERVHQQLAQIIQQGATLAEVAVDEEDNLVLAVGRSGKSQLYLVIGGWLLEEWDELPDA